MRAGRWVMLGVVAATAAGLLSVAGPASAVTETDVALGSTATATLQGVTAPTCSATSGPSKAVDGAWSNIYTDKWCVPSGQPVLNLKLNGSAYGYTVSHIVVMHAGVAGESASYNTRAFRLQVIQTASTTPLTVATVTGNTANQTSNNVGLANVSQVRLLIDLPTQAGTPTGATRIYEVQVWGVPTTTPRPPTTMSGRAQGLSASGLVSIAPTPDTGQVSTTTSETVAPSCTSALTGLIATQSLCVKVATTASPAKSTATASVGGSTIGVLGLPVIRIGATSSSSSSTCSGSTGGATVASLSIGGIPQTLTANPAPNTTLSVLGITIVLNEQSAVPGVSAGLHVNAIHIKALGLLDVIVASSESAVANCP